MHRNTYYFQHLIISCIQTCVVKDITIQYIWTWSYIWLLLGWVKTSLSLLPIYYYAVMVLEGWVRQYALIIGYFLFEVVQNVLVAAKVRHNMTPCSRLIMWLREWELSAVLYEWDLGDREVFRPLACVLHCKDNIWATWMVFPAYIYTSSLSVIS